MRKSILHFFGAVFFVLSPPSLVQSEPVPDLAGRLSDIADQVSALGKQVGVLGKKIETLETKEKVKAETETRMDLKSIIEKNQELEEEIDFLQQQVTLFQKVERGLNFSFYGTLEFEDFQNTDSSFDARSIELFVDARLTDRLRGFAEIEFEKTATTEPGNRQGEVEVEQGWMEYSINPYINPRAGVILVPFGRFNLEHFDPFRDLTDRPIAMRRVIPATWSAAGAGFTGNFPLGEKLGINALQELSLDYQFYFINGLTNEISDQGTRSARGSFGSDNNGNKAAVGRLNVSPFPDYEVGLSGYFGEYDDKGREISGFDVDWKFVQGPLEFIGEYAFFDPQNGGLQRGSTTLTVPGKLHGGYAQTNYHFWFDFLNDTFLAKSFSNPTFTAILRYGEATIDDDNDPGTGSNEEYRWTFGLNYRPVETFVFKVEYQFNHTKNEALEKGSRDGFVASVSAAFF